MGTRNLNNLTRFLPMKIHISFNTIPIREVSNQEEIGWFKGHMQVAPEL